MNVLLEESPPVIIGLDTGRKPILLLTTISDDYKAGAVIPEETEEFASLFDFSSYWNAHWRNSGVRVAVATDPADPLGARAWLEGIGQPVESYDWSSCRLHLRDDLTLQDCAVDRRYERAYVLALYACHRKELHCMITTLWDKLFEASYLLKDVQHSLSRLAAALPPPDPGLDDELPF